MSFDRNKLLFWQAWRDGINKNIFSIFSVISIQWSSMSLCYTLLVLKSLIVEICIKMSKLHMVLGIIHHFSRKIVMPFIYNIWNAWNWCDLKYAHKLAWISCEGAVKEKGSSRRLSLRFEDLAHFGPFRFVSYSYSLNTDVHFFQLS